MTQLGPYLTATDVARRFDTTPATVRRWVNDGKLPAVRTPGGRIKFRRSDIDALIPEPDEAPTAGQVSA